MNQLETDLMCSAIVPQGSIMLATRLCYQNIRNQNELFCKNRYWGAMLEGLWVINVYTMRHLDMRFIFALLFYDKGIFPEGLYIWATRQSSVSERNLLCGDMQGLMLIWSLSMTPKIIMLYL